MAEKSLHRSNIGPVTQQVCSKGVSDDVRSHSFSNARLCCIFLHDPLDRARCQTPRFASTVLLCISLGMRDKKRIINISPLVQIITHRIFCSVRKEHYSDLLTLTTDSELIT